MGLTEKTIKALKILDVEYGKELTAGQFAREMWPDSPGWRRVKNQGHGATSGKGMWLSAGSYLAKLRKRRLVSVRIDGSLQVFATSFDGKKALEKCSNERSALIIDSVIVSVCPNCHDKNPDYNKISKRYTCYRCMTGWAK